MKLLSLRRVLLILAVLAVAAPAIAEEPLPPVFNRSEVWFHGTSRPVTNLDAEEGSVPTWNGTKPTASVPGGAGSVYAANNVSFLTSGVDHKPGDHFTVRGPLTGDVDTMAVTLFAHLPTEQVMGCGIDLAFELVVDDYPILYQGQLEASHGMAVKQVSGSLYSVKFVFTRLHQMLQESGIATGPDVEHAISLNVMNFYVCQEAVWVYDSAEAPAGAIFNAAPEELAGYTTVDVFNPPPPQTTG